MNTAEQIAYRIPGAAVATAIGLAAALMLSACGGGGGGGDDPVKGKNDTFTVGGAVSGLAGSGLILRNNGSDTLIIATNGNFTMPTALGTGAAYVLTVATQPSAPAQTCLITNGTGSVGSGNVTNIAVACTTNTYTIGGAVTGLTGAGLVLRNNGGNAIALNAAGPFVFTTAIASGSGYAVTVDTQPTNPSQICVVTNGVGTVVNGNVTSVAIACTTNTYTIGGLVGGMTGTGLILRNNGGNDLTVNANGAFAFSTPLNSGANYAVTVFAQPSNPLNQCSVTGGQGQVGAQDIVTISVQCSPATFTVSGNVTGLTGDGLVLRNNGGDDLNIASNGAFIFGTALPNGSAYNVTIGVSPRAPIQQCTVSNGSGTQTSGNIANVGIACTDVVPRFISSMNFTSGTFASFRVEPSTGELRSVGYVKVGANPISFGVLPSPLDSNIGFTYTLNQGSADITGSISNRTTNATIGPIPGSPFSLPSTPNSFSRHPSNRFLYVVHSTANNISGYAINESTGALTAVPGGTFAAGTNPISLVFTANGQFAFVVNQGSANIYTYSVNTTTGALTEMVANRIATGTGPRPLVVHSSGGFGYVTNAGSANISAYTINATTGALTAMASSPIAAGTNPGLFGIHPNGRFAYVTNIGSNDLSAYAINGTTGALTPLGGSPYPTGTSPTSFIFDVTSRFMYVSSSLPPAPTLQAFGVDGTTGLLSAVGTPLVVIPSPSLVTEPSGKFLYVGSTGSSTIAGYNINQTTGVLTPFAGTPVVTTGVQPRFLVSTLPSATPVTVTPKYFYIANDGGAANGNVSPYAINATTGVLTSAGGSALTRVTPRGIATTRDGKFVYVVNEGSNSISAFATNNGVLTEIAGSPFPTAALPHYIGVDAGGRFAYVANDTSISTYTIDGTTGALTSIGAPIASGTYPETIAIDHNARCAFAPNNGDNTLAAFSIDSSSGALTSAGAPLATGLQPVAAVVHPSGRYVYVTNDGNNTVSAFSLVPNSSCTLTANGTPVSAGPAGFGIITIAVEPTGRFAYVGNQATGEVSVMSVNQSTGALTLVGTPISAGVTVQQVTADPSGRFLYVNSRAFVGAGRTIRTYNINPITGAITLAVGTPLAAPNANASAVVGELQL